MSAVRLSGEASIIDALQPQLLAAGFVVSPKAQCFLHVGAARDTVRAAA